MTDDMFFTSDARSLRRGKRRSARTETCRPCLLWPEDAPDMRFQAVAIDVSPYGLLVRMLDILGPGTVVRVQLMRDDAFSEPMAPPLSGIIVRADEDEAGFVDHGVQLVRPDIQRIPERPIRVERRRASMQSRPRTRMHTLDFILSDRGIQRME